MTRTYIFEWYATRDAKYSEPHHRINNIKLSHPCGHTDIDAKNALNLFMSSFGNLKKNTIVRIKEIGEDGQIGEDIVPSDENSIIPSGK